MRYEEIDWNELWREARRRKSWAKKGNADWDKRASDFAARNLDSPYVEQFLTKAVIPEKSTVLDIGCGPGTLALPIAKRAARVTAVDFSKAMLDELAGRARERGLHNIRPIHASWEDDWESLGIEPHDIAIASRSLSVDDLEKALVKLDRWARHRVYVSDRVGSGPFDPDVFEAVGRPFEPGPDYIYTVNILYRLGIHARVDFITLSPARLYDSTEEAIRSHRWMFDDLTPEEEQRLTEYVLGRCRPHPGGRIEFVRRHPPKWALIWWEKESADQSLV